jgi:hypothetical protein
MHASLDRCSRRPFNRAPERLGRDDGLRRTRPFARPSGLNWLQVALRMDENEAGLERGLDALGPFDLPARGRR